MIQKTLILLKPETVKRGFVGEIVSKFEKAGIKIVGMKMFSPTKDILNKHYHEHLDKDFYSRLEKTMLEGPLIAMALEGSEVIDVVRKMVGTTEPKTALPGTIRGDYGHISYERSNQKGVAVKNVIHASDCKESAEKELKIWFSDEELHNYSTVHEEHTI